jgi:hypothetical protein
MPETALQRARDTGCSHAQASAAPAATAGHSNEAGEATADALPQRPSARLSSPPPLPASVSLDSISRAVLRPLSSRALASRQTEAAAKFASSLRNT